MIFVLLLYHIGNVFLYFELYGHGKSDLEFVHGRVEKRVGSNMVCPKQVYISEAEITEKNNITKSFGEKVCLFADTFTYVSNCYHK